MLVEHISDLIRKLDTQPGFLFQYYLDPGSLFRGLLELVVSKNPMESLYRDQQAYDKYKKDISKQGTIVILF